jgi:hypothetical protein
MMLNNSLTRYSGLLSVPAAVAVAVITAAVPLSTHAQEPLARADARPLDTAAARWSAHRSLIEPDLVPLDPFADEELADDLALEARLAAEDNLELI